MVESRTVLIKAPNMVTAEFVIRGTAPYVSNKFSGEARGKMRTDQEAGHAKRKGAKREPKNFKQCYEQSYHRSTEGWAGMPASAFRQALVRACSLVGFKMTLGKLALFVEADGFDAEDSTPLVRFSKGEPEYFEAAVRNSSGVCDLRARALWRPGWEVALRLRFDGDMFSLEDVTNLLMRVGQQVGIGAGRPDSKTSCGMGWGLFEIVKETSA